MGKGSLDEIIQQPVQPHLEHPQWWGFCHIPGEIVPMTVLTVEHLFYIKTKLLPVQLVPIAPGLLHVSPCEERASFLFAAALEVLESCNEVPQSLLFSKVKRNNSSLSSFGRFSSPLVILVALFWTLSSLFMFCLELWGPELDTVLQVQSGKCWVEWDAHISMAASNGLEHTAHDPICLPCFSTVLLTHIQLVDHQEPPSPFLGGCIPATKILARTGLFGYAVTVKGPCTHHVKLHTVLPCPLFQSKSLRRFSFLTCPPHHTV